MLSEVDKSFEEYTTSMRNNEGSSWKYPKIIRLRQYFKYYRKHRPRKSRFVMTEVTFSSIINAVCAEIAEVILQGEIIQLPFRMGKLSLVSRDSCNYFDEDGKFHMTGAIDWPSTHKLWYEDPESRANKKLVRLETSTIYRVRYWKQTACYTNKSIISFSTCRTLKAEIRKRVQDNKLNCLIRDKVWQHDIQALG